MMCQGFLHLTLLLPIWRHWCNYTSTQNNPKPFGISIILLCWKVFKHSPVNAGFHTRLLLWSEHMLGMLRIHRLRSDDKVLALQVRFLTAVSSSNSCRLLCRPQTPDSDILPPVDHKLRAFVNQTLCRSETALCGRSGSSFLIFITLPLLIVSLSITLNRWNLRVPVGGRVWDGG